MRVADVCASFQAAVVDVLTGKTISAAKKLKLNKIVVGGGVSANSALRAKFMSEGRKNGIKVYLPSKKFCTDNAAMVASLGYYKFKKGMDGRAPASQTRVDPSLPIKNWP